LAGSAVIQALDVDVPLLTLNGHMVVRLLLGELAYLGVNYLLGAFYIAGHGSAALRDYVRSLPRLSLFEGLPILIAPLFPVVYAELGLAYVLLFAASLAAASLISHSFSGAAATAATCDGVGFIAGRRPGVELQSRCRDRGGCHL